MVDEIAADRGLVRIRQSDYLAAFRLPDRAPVRVGEARVAGTTDAHAGGRSAKSGSTPRTVWVYWEGPMPGYIDLCIQTVRSHNPRVELLDRDGFDTLFRDDRDLPIDAPLPASQSGLYPRVPTGTLWRVVPRRRLRSARQSRPRVRTRRRSRVRRLPRSARVHEQRLHGIGARRGGDSGSLPKGVRGVPSRDESWPGSTSARSPGPGRSRRTPTGVIAATLTESVHAPVLAGGVIDWPNRRTDDAGTHLLLRADAICYMLSNNTIKSRRTTRALTYMPAADLLADSYFLSFLFRRALGRERTAPASPVVFFTLGGARVVRPVPTRGRSTTWRPGSGSDR